MNVNLHVSINFHNKTRACLKKMNDLNEFKEDMRLIFTYSFFKITLLLLSKRLKSNAKT